MVRMSRCSRQTSRTGVTILCPASPARALYAVSTTSSASSFSSHRTGRHPIPRTSGINSYTHIHDLFPGLLRRFRVTYSHSSSHRRIYQHFFGVGRFATSSTFSRASSNTNSYFLYVFSLSICYTINARFAGRACNLPWPTIGQRWGAGAWQGKDHCCSTWD